MQEAQADLGGAIVWSLEQIEEGVDDEAQAGVGHHRLLTGDQGGSVTDFDDALDLSHALTVRDHRALIEFLSDDVVVGRAATGVAQRSPASLSGATYPPGAINERRAILQGLAGARSRQAPGRP